ncbi:hypothetical protein D3C72_1950970 [compost metagenome]
MPTIEYDWRAAASEISFSGACVRAAAASASSCTWHERSIVINHQAASSTVLPTVSRPWFCKIAALFWPSALAMRWPSSSSTTTPPKSS